jgi:rhomboid protease GluP
MRSKPAKVPVTVGVIVVNGLVFIAMLLAGAGWWHAANGVPLAWGANFAPATQDGQWWRLFTAMFIHFGVVHLALNMWALWDVGRLVEQLYGRANFALLYGASGLAGNLVSLAVQGNQAVSGGASGAVFSLFGALLVFLWQARAEIERLEFRWLFGGALGFPIAMLAMGWWVTGIDNAAHAGGFGAGCLFGLMLMPPRKPAGSNSTSLRWLAGCLLSVATAVLLLRLPEPSYRFGEELQVRSAIQNFLELDRKTTRQFNALVIEGPSEGLTFEQIAGKIDSEVAGVYAQSFEQLLQAQPTTHVPSQPQLDELQRYAAERAEKAREAAAALRQQAPHGLPAPSTPDAPVRLK